MINERRIQYFLAVCQEGNITTAARKLYVSQPALSRMIGDIEAELGSPLFLRDHDGVTLTRAGEIYRDTCLQIRSACEDMKRQIGDLAGRSDRVITLGFANFTGDVVLPDVLERFRKCHPATEVVLTEAMVSQLPDLVRRGMVDLALSYQSSDPELCYIPMTTEKIYLAVPESFYGSREDFHLGFDNPPISSGELRHRPFILRKKGRAVRALSDRLFAEYDIQPQVVFETGSANLSYLLTLKNEGFSLIPGIVAQYMSRNLGPGVFAQFREEPLERTLYVCYRRDLYLSQARKDMLAILHAVLNP